MLASIGGSGLTQLSSLGVTRRLAVRTPYGEPSAVLIFGQMRDKEVCFIARHGYGHTIAPHEVNYRANIWALREVGIKRIISVASVGGIGPTMTPGTLALPKQIIDYTWGRPSTFFEGGDTEVTHIDLTHPYSLTLRDALKRAADTAHEPVVDAGVYACTQGPRLETAAEINRLERDGCDLVGMTGMPEAALARELALEYAAIAVVANYAAGRGDSASGIKLAEIEAVLHNAMTRAKRVIEEAVAQLA